MNTLHLHYTTVLCLVGVRERVIRVTRQLSRGEETRDQQQMTQSTFCFESLSVRPECIASTFHRMELNAICPAIQGSMGTETYDTQSKYSTLLSRFFFTYSTSTVYSAAALYHLKKQSSGRERWIQFIDVQ